MKMEIEPTPSWVDSEVCLNTRLLTYDLKVRKNVSNKVRWYEYKDKEVIGIIISNILACLRKGNILVYSRKLSYRAGSSKKMITPGRVIKGIDFLEKNGYLVNRKGIGSADKDKRSVSWVQPTEKFMTEWKGEKICMQAEQDYLESCCVVELRDSEKMAIPYRNSDHIQRMTDTVRRLNKMNEGSVIRDGKGGILTNIYCRIFNESFEYGGRFYRADVLAIKNSVDNARLDITIDNERVVEVDYSNLHFRIAAAMEDLDSEDIPLDVYSGILEDETNLVDRQIVKLAVNMMFNCKNEDAARMAIQKEINMMSIDDKMQYTLGTAKSVMALIKEAYPNFGHKFCTEESFGRILQNADSHLASDILQVMIDKNITCLPVHDSFIVQLKHMDFLCETMGNCFRERFNHKGIVPVGIKWKENHNLMEEKVCV